MADQVDKTMKRICVTGAAGYIGSWLIKNLLERGYTVNATLRNPGDATKSRPLLELAGAEESLKLFKADLCLEGSFDSAVDGFHGVFHVASPMDFTKANPDRIHDFQDDFIVPAVNGVHNVMRACVGAKSVRRVILTSSVTTASSKNDKGEFTQTCLDEKCWSSIRARLDAGIRNAGYDQFWKMLQFWKRQILKSNSQIGMTCLVHQNRNFP